MNKDNPVFLLAPDSFKGSLTAKEVCISMEKAIHRIFPNAKCIRVPMADGGEGTMQSLVDATNGQIFETEVKNPLGNPVIARYGILGDGKTAVIEMASASGLTLIPDDLKNPMNASTYGTGQLIEACLNKGIRKIILGIGGSATNDGGAGMAKALGVQFLDKDGIELSEGGAVLIQLAKIDVQRIDSRLKDTEIEVACDVDNPLCGDFGASYVYGKQKGATEKQIVALDNALQHYADVIKQQLGKDIDNVAGAGAAGGLGAGLLAFTQCELKRGIDIVIEYTGLDRLVRNADWVFTGEGRIDFQTQFGKTPYGVAQAAKRYNKPVIAIAGSVGKGIDQLYDCGFDAIFSITPCPMTLQNALNTGKENIELTMENIARMIFLRLF